jgi:hypothetical protein
MRTHNKNGKWGQRVKAWGAGWEETGDNADARGKGIKMLKIIGLLQLVHKSQYRFLGLGRATTTTSSGPPSVPTTAVTTAIDTLPRTSDPRPAHRPLATFLLRLKEYSEVSIIDLNATLAAVIVWERRNDGTLGRFDLFEFEKRAGLVADDFKLLDSPKARDNVPQRVIRNTLHHTLDKTVRV